MTPDQFTYWLKGFSEISGQAAPDYKQWRIIQDHLDLVFNKVTPVRTNPSLPDMLGYPYPYSPNSASDLSKVDTTIRTIC